MVSAGFIMLTILVASMLVLATYHIPMAKATLSRRNALKLAVFLALLFSYIAVIASSGVLNSPRLPPRIPILLVFPVFILIIYFFIAKEFRVLISAIRPHWGVYLQTFRVVVELLIFGLFLEGNLPKAATFEGYNYDIIMGLTAPVVAYLGYQKRLLNKTMLLTWNIAGLVTLAIVVYIILGSIYFSPDPVRAGIIARALGSFPFALLPGFLMPVAVFLHVLSIFKIAGPPEKL